MHTAVRAARLHEQLLPNAAFGENYTAPNGQCIAMPAATLAALRTRGDIVNRTSAPNGVVQLVAVDPDSGVLHAVSDQRKEGTPAGF